MRLLFVHDRYIQRGGEDECYDQEVALLRSNGEDVREYIVDNHLIEGMKPWQAALTTIWSTESYRNISQLCKEFHPDLIHVHNYFPLISPSVFYASKDNRIPIVQTLHNYRLFCLNGLFFREGSICTDCYQKIPISGIQHSCYRQSRLASFAVASMLMTHRFLKTWERKVDAFIALTQFAKEKFIEGGISEKLIYIKPNFISPDPGYSEEKRDIALFVGRLSSEKGILTLLNAWKYLEDSIPLVIIGDGPLNQQVIEASMRQKNIIWLGKKTNREVLDILGTARFLVFPSECYEGMPRVILEAFSKGTPVIASRLGSMIELINEGVDGLLFEPKNPTDLVDKVNQILANPVQLSRMQKLARQEFEQKYTAERSLNTLFNLYREVLQSLH